MILEDLRAWVYKIMRGIEVVNAQSFTHNRRTKNQRP